MNIKIKRVYEQPGEEDGMRILVDRLWPRGLTKAKASVDLWLKDIAPSLIYGAKDEEHNEAVVLQAYLSR